MRAVRSCTKCFRGLLGSSGTSDNDAGLSEVMLQRVAEPPSEAISRKASRDSFGKLRDSQDIEFEEALAEDNAFEERKRREEEARAEEARRQEEEKRIKLEEAEEAMRKHIEHKSASDERRKRKAAALPVPDASAKVRISMRIPCGKRLTRRSSFSKWDWNCHRSFSIP